MKGSACRAARYHFTARGAFSSASYTRLQEEGLMQEEGLKQHCAFERWPQQCVCKRIVRAAAETYEHMHGKTVYVGGRPSECVIERVVHAAAEERGVTRHFSLKGGQVSAFSSASYTRLQRCKRLRDASLSCPHAPHVPTSSPHYASSERSTHFQSYHAPAQQAHDRKVVDARCARRRGGARQRQRQLLRLLHILKGKRRI